MVKKREGKPVQVIKVVMDKNKTVKKFLDTLEVGSPISYDNLTIFPIFRPIEKRIEKLKTLSEALELKIVDIKETGTVSEIEIVNKSDDTKILILEGETIKGGAQNRVINTTIILDEKSSIRVPTTCVQQHRWNTFDAPFTKTDYSPPDVLTSLSASVSRSMSTSRGSGGSICYAADQTQIWDKCSVNLGYVSSGDSTGDIHSVYKEKAPDIDKAYSKIKPYLPTGEDWVGIISVIDNMWFLGDICDEHDIAKNHLERLIKSHIYQALVSQNRVQSSYTQEFIVEFLDKFGQIEYEQFDSLTKNGKEFRYSEKSESLEQNASILFYKDELVHFLLSQRHIMR